MELGLRRDHAPEPDPLPPPVALDTRFDSAFMCKECVTVSAQKISLLRTESPMRLLHWRGGWFTRVNR
jgi:hypothetical protein